MANMLNSQGLNCCMNLALMLTLSLVWIHICIAESPAWLYEHASIGEESVRVVHRESEQDTLARLKRNVKPFSDELFPNELNFRLTTGQHAKEIALKKNSLLMTGHKVYTVKGGKVVVDDTANKTKHATRYYQSPEHGAAVVVTCFSTPEHDCRHLQMAGVLNMAGQLFLLLPRISNTTTLLQHPSIKHEDYLLRKLDSNIDFTGDFLPRPENLNRPHIHHHSSRVKRTTNAYIVEMLMILDYSVFQYWYEKTDPNLPESEREVAAKDLMEEYYAFALNGVDMRYKSIAVSDISLSVSYAGLVIVTTPEESPWTEAHVNNASPDKRKPLNASTAIEALHDWIATDPDLPEFDHVMLFTAHDMVYGASSSTIGIAYVGTICSNYGVSIVENYFDFNGITTAAHELAHSLGAHHDGVPVGNGPSCLKTSGFIMTPASSYGYAIPENRWYFSSCSVDDFRDIISELDADDANCLEENLSSADNSDITEYLVNKPGQLYTIDQQCSYALNAESYLCRSLFSVSTAYTVCSTALCFIPESGGYCRAITPAEGTPCGDKKWCINGECVTDANANPGTDFTDACPFGDKPGVVFNGETCSEMASSYPYGCRFLSGTCCSSCGAISTVNEGCEYGDGIHACTGIHPRLCYDNEDLCCGTCHPIKNANNIGCEYGDRIANCVARDCGRYSENTKRHCCSTCQTSGQLGQPSLGIQP